jgi:hypothetical protein
MNMFEYVMVLASVIIGLGVTHLLQGVAIIIQHPGRKPIYWVHLIWVGIVLFQCMFWWWWQFAYSETETWTFLLYLFVLLFATVAYLLCAVVMPSDMEGYRDFRDFFYSRRAWIFGALILFNLFDLADTALKGAEHFASLGLQYPIRMGAFIALNTVAAVVRNERFHALFAVANAVYQIPWAIVTFATVA